MHDLRLLIWLTQLGLSVAIPLGGSLMLGIWLHDHLGWGIWTVFAGLVLGILCAVRSFRDSLKAMDLMAGNKKKSSPPSVSFDRHE